MAIIAIKITMENHPLWWRYQRGLSYAYLKEVIRDIEFSLGWRIVCTMTSSIIHRILKMV